MYHVYRCQKLKRIGSSVTDRIRNPKCQDESKNKKIKIDGYKSRICIWVQDDNHSGAECGR